MNLEASEGHGRTASCKKHISKKESKDVWQCWHLMMHHEIHAAQGG